MGDVSDHVEGEIRQDLITGKWVVIARARSDRPRELGVSSLGRQKIRAYEKNCPFCNLGDYPQEPDTIRLPSDHNWQVHIFPNKYPAFVPADTVRQWDAGPYRALAAVGYHELLATREHDQLDTEVTVETFALKWEALIRRYRQLMQKQSVRYIQIIKNVGERAGASLSHPHWQIFTTPIVPRDVSDLLFGAERYLRQYQRSPFEVIREEELRERVRIVCENSDFFVFCPFASRLPYEMWVMPKDRSLVFHELEPALRISLAEIMQAALKRLERAVPGIHYNYVVHVAPCDDSGFVCDIKLFRAFGWHVQILPRLGTWGGLELGSGLEINPVAPEQAAHELRTAVK